MFGRKQSKTSIEVTKLSSLVADNLHIVGDVHFSGGLRIDGKVEGNVLGKKGEKSLLVLSDKGCIVGRVHAHDAVVNGTISGDLQVEHLLELHAGAKVSGNISYRQLQMECGATIEGQLVRVVDTPRDAKKVIGLAATQKPLEPPPLERPKPSDSATG